MEVSSQHHALIILPPQRQKPGPTEQKVMRASQLVQTFWRKSTFLAPTQTRTLIIHPRSTPKEGLPGCSSPPTPQIEIKKEDRFCWNDIKNMK